MLRTLKLLRHFPWKSRDKCWYMTDDEYEDYREEQTFHVAMMLVGLGMMALSIWMMVSLASL